MDSERERLKVTGIMQIVVAIIAVILNTLTLAAILANRRMRVENAHIFILNVASVDLLYAVSVILPIGVWNYVYEWYGSILHCKLQLYLEAGLSYVSNFSVALVAFDKYLYISRPFQYEAWMQPRAVGVMLGLSWIVPLIGMIYVLLSYVFIGEEIHCTVELPIVPFRIGTILFFIAPFVVIVVCGCSIIVIVRRHQRRIAALEVVVTSSAGAAGGPTSSQRVSFRAVITVLSVVACFLLLQAPMHMGGVIRNLCGNCFPYDVIYEYLFYPLYVSAGVNPLLYVFTERRYRRAVGALLCSWRQSVLRRHGDNGVSTSAGSSTNRTHTTVVQVTTPQGDGEQATAHKY